MTRFPRRATILAALLVAPLGFGLTAAAPAAIAAAAPAAHVVVDAATTELTAATKKAKKAKKKKKVAAKKPAAKPAPVTTKPVEASTLETEVVTLTNAYRVKNGCGAMRIDARLVASARAHSTDMVTKNYFSHTGSDGSDFVTREARAGYSPGASAENIAWGYKTPQQVVDGWINSAGHRANILNCSSIAVGVGLAYKADGTPYWTQNFGRV